MTSVTINGLGCSLLDILYTDIDFSSRTFKRYCAREEGDGGLVPGKLVFAEDFQRFAGAEFASVLREITGGRAPDHENLGGPAIVALVNAAQLLHSSQAHIRFFGTLGNDRAAGRILEILGRTDVDIRDYEHTPGISPSTVVLSDPRWDHGNGERAFINTLGVAADYTPHRLPDEFWEGEILFFGGTALVPGIHDSLSSLVRRAKDRERTTVLSTVYDFRNQQISPSRRWPLGETDETYAHTDLLVTDQEEALRLSGTDSIDRACRFFIAKDTGAFIITRGSRPVVLCSAGGLFRRLEPTEIPVSGEVEWRLKSRTNRAGDTTGCGDNFVGGVLASMAAQLGDRPKGELDLKEAAAWGICSGGFACFYPGGTFEEHSPGEKRGQITGLLRAYRKQVGGSFPVSPGKDV